MYEEIPEISGKLLDDHTLEEEKMVSSILENTIHIEHWLCKTKNMNLVKIKVWIQTILF